MSDFDVYKSMFWRGYSLQHVKWQAALEEKIWEKKRETIFLILLMQCPSIAIDANCPLGCEAFSHSLGHSLMMLHREAPPAEEACLMNMDLPTRTFPHT